jgi:competence protein ComEC
MAKPTLRRVHVACSAVAALLVSLLTACPRSLGHRAEVERGANFARPKEVRAAAQEPGRPRPLRIVWIDVEGGAATLIIAPTGESLLADTGWPGNDERDAQRIADVVAAEVPSKRIDHCLVTHYHIDHVGGVPALARRVEIREYIDHGANVEASGEYEAYVATAQGRRVTARPGDRWMLGSVEIVVVSSAGRFIEQAVSAASDEPSCRTAKPPPLEPGDENPMSIGFVARFGRFEFLDLGDLTKGGEHRLVCPHNRLGAIDLWQVDHHGSELSNAAEFVHAIDFGVAVMDNGARKGGAAATFDTLRNQAPGRDVWQLHRAVAIDALRDEQAPLIANFAVEPDAAYAVSASVETDGSFTVTNHRTGASRAYVAR